MKAMIVLLWTLGALFVSVQDALSAAPTRFAIVSDAPDSQIGLDTRFKIRLLDGDQPDDCKKINLLVGDASGLSTQCSYGPQREAIFVLSRNEQNKSQWREFLGSPLTRDRVITLPVSVQIGNDSLAFSPDGAQPTATVQLRLYRTDTMTVGLVLSFLVIVFTVGFAKHTYMIRDALIPQMLRSERPYSLGRFQMAMWFVLIFTSFIFILSVTNDLNSLNTESFTLLGISSATALGAVAIDQSKNDPVARIEAQVNALGLNTCADVLALRDLALSPATQGQTVPAIQLPPGMPASTTYLQLWQLYQAAVDPIRSRGFVKDLVTDINGPTLYRWQIVVWTLVLGAVYAVKVYTNLETPLFGSALLTLMGISSGVYLGFKVPERQV
jgi:hypothetical protein